MEETRQKLIERVKELPETPGVYLFKDAKGRIIYVGKANSLRQRVRSYFSDTHGGPLTYWMVGEATSLDFIVTDSPMEALMLENNLIKKNQPRYNILLRDDKTHPYIKLTVQEDFPRAYIVRRVRKDGAAYFGPFIPASLAKKTLNLIYRYFMLRQCTIRITDQPQRLCLLYYIHRCLGPCAQKSTRQEYDRAVTDVKMFLEGNKDDLMTRVREQMMEHSKKQEFELAANYRDLMKTIEELNTRPKLVSYELDDADIFGFARNDENTSVQIFFMRSGQVVGRHEFFFESKLVANDGSLMSHLLMQFYSMPRFVPKNIYVPREFPDRKIIEEWLAKKKGKKVKILHPQRGKKRELVALVTSNAKIGLEINSTAGRVHSHETLEALQKTIGMAALPYRIEAFDISNIQGTNSVASLVVWEAGRPKKSEYRKYRIQGVVGPDDFRSMSEVVERRISGLLEKGQPLPDLILIDGGKGQLNAAHAMLKNHDLHEQPIFGLAKREEEIFLPNRSDSIKLDERSPVRKLIQQIRDEAHRFAITYHRQLRAKHSKRMALDEIEGIGPKRKKKLIQHFGSLENMKSATREQLQEQLGKITGGRLYGELHGE